MQINFSDLTKQIKQTFPTIELCVCYGSAAFQQANYDYTQKPLIDLIFVVDNVYEFHKENLQINRNHYSFPSNILKQSYLSFLQQNLMPIHYNPYVQVGEYNIKYGVISQLDYLIDLNQWNNFIIAGRLQKPVRILFNDSIMRQKQYDKSLLINRKSALNLSLLLLNKDVFTKKMLFKQITELSYIGDIRFSLGGENQNKIENIVEGQMEQFNQIYDPLLKEKQKLFLFQENDCYKLDIDFKARKLLLEGLVSRMKIMYGAPLYSLLMNQDLKTQNHNLKQYVYKMNSSNSKKMIFYHLLTTSPAINCAYALKKLQKRFKK